MEKERARVKQAESFGIGFVCLESIEASRTKDLISSQYLLFSRQKTRV